jgi:L-rhamnose mutarotase
MTRHCFACDLVDNEAAIAQYKEYHKEGNAWPEITESIRAAGILDMQIYLIGNRLFMIMEVSDKYVPEEKAKLDAANLKVQEWEDLMSTFQQAVPWAHEGEKWTLMEQIFKL